VIQPDQSPSVPRAGRKPNIAKRLLGGLKPMAAVESLEGIDVRLNR